MRRLRLTTLRFEKCLAAAGARVLQRIGRLLVILLLEIRLDRRKQPRNRVCNVRLDPGAWPLCNQDGTIEHRPIRFARQIRGCHATTARGLWFILYLLFHYLLLLHNHSRSRGGGGPKETIVGRKAAARASSRRPADGSKPCLGEVSTIAIAILRRVAHYGILHCQHPQLKTYSNHQEQSVPYVPIPTIVERTPRGERSWDLFSRLLQERVILLGTPIDDEVASSIVAQLLFLQHADPQRDIWFYINSPGGSVRDGLAIYDTMQLISPDVCTVCIGRAGSMATILLAGGARGKRYALPNATIHFHPAGGGAEGYAPDMERIVRELLRIQEVGNGLLGKDTGKTAADIARDFSRDRFMTPAEARDYGFIDSILEPKKN